MAEDAKPLLLGEDTSSSLQDDEYGINSEKQDSKPKSSRSHLILAICACIFGSPLQIGLNTAILNTPQDVIKSFYNQTYHDRYGKEIEGTLLTLLWAITVSFFCIGGMLGGLVAPTFAGKYGRKQTLILNNFIALACAILQGNAKTSGYFEMLIAGRIVAGICCGVVSAVAPLYLAEISPTSLRGFCGTCNQLSITMGVVLAQVLGLSSVLGTEDLWPFLVAAPAVPAIFSFLTLSWCPESPRFLLVVKENETKARKAMMWLRNSSDIAEDLEAITIERNEHRNSPKLSPKDLFKNPELRWPLIICIVLQMSQQFSGINAVIYYSTSIFKSAGLTTTSSQYATLGTGCINVLMTFVSALIMDRAGRRTLHMTGLGGMFTFSVLLVICLSLQSQASWLSYISIVAVVIYIIFFATGPGSIPWFMVAEMFAQGPRTAAVSVSVVVNWLCNFVVGICYPILQKAITTYSFLPFCVMLAFFFIFTYLFVPETKGKTITEITMLFREQTDSAAATEILSPALVEYEITVEEDNSIAASHRHLTSSLEGSQNPVSYRK
ncbi:solute carrier family 2, facilitated glucose transporter member 1 [Plakobranchus ocellatus]|uniref:Solute carrier family 2, facilitated glucose transporter member 1 n=1 Tax=Plakobranchus ocellatus TaxID=259542 RepID=A0AAV4BQU1_9GAST|nr:solute carrier family 2, facilitated glucose transporter member 1 [Plakobranchus ocellatus]